MAKNPNKINPFKDKVLGVNIVFEFNNVSAVRWDVDIWYKKTTLSGVIYKSELINGLTSSNSLKRSKSYWAIMNSIVNQNLKNQLKLAL